jgi:hypothetical protein
MSSSPSISFLRELAERRALFELLIIDNNNDGAFVVSCKDCIIVKTPDLMRGREIGDITIQFFIPYLERRIPGVNEILAA